MSSHLKERIGSPCKPTRRSEPFDEWPWEEAKIDAIFRLEGRMTLTEVMVEDIWIGSTRSNRILASLERM